MLSEKGSPLPLGVSQSERGYNFALFAKHAQKVRFCLFAASSKEPFFQQELDSVHHKTGDIWHIRIQEIPPQAEYGFIIDGPQLPEKGFYYDNRALTADPYSKALNFPHQWGGKRPEQLRGLVQVETPFDWENDHPPLIPKKELIIYEMHVRGFTQHPSSLVAHPGTYLGMIEKIPYLKELGINAVELLPVFEFNECEYTQQGNSSDKQLYNYWGYSTVNFFTPMKRYSSSDAHSAAINEFKLLVKELHKAGIEIILDVVYNHSSLQGDHSPFNSFRNIDNPIYYLLDDQGGYKNYSGCGNTLNCNHPVVSELILNSLRYWVSEMHVDGFRFDLASILTRNQDGSPAAEPFVITAISEDPILSHVKLIAEAWDAAGLYQVGHFPYPKRWSDWNGQYRDTVRDFIKGTNGKAESFVRALTGSEYLYGKTESPYHGVNFITAHDGFSLHDLVSYGHKHNDANGENNQDGTNDNRSWNCGVEGETNDPVIIQLRNQQKRNFHLALMMSLGIPMIVMGDEYGRTAFGNNNTWCQDNELNWFLWDTLEKEKDLFFRFYRLVIHLRKQLFSLFPNGFYKDTDVAWHSAQAPFHPTWGEETRFVALTLQDKSKGQDVYLAFNACHHEIDILLPPPSNGNQWYRIIDTARLPPDDFIENPVSLPPLTQIYKMPSHSALLLQSLSI